MTRTRPALFATALVAAAGLAALTGCPAARTAAATQPSPKTFDIAASDPKAVQLIDAMVAKLGGWDRWNAVKQIAWSERFTVSGDLRGIYSHAWDRWNGRHRLETEDLRAYAAAQEADDSRLRKSYLAMYDLFDHEHSGSAFSNDDPVPRADARRMINDAYNRWLVDHYLLTVLYKTKDPGVKLAYEGERPADQFCQETCDVIKVTFDPAVGKDAYFIDLLRSTGLPQLIEIEEGGKQGRIGYKLEDWTDVGGLKFAQKLSNVASPEVITFSDIAISEPDDRLYIPPVQ